MSEDLDMGGARAQHTVSLNVRKAVFRAIHSEAPDLARELGFSGDADERGDYTGPWSYHYRTLPEFMIKLREAAEHPDATRRRVAIQATGEAAACAPVLAGDAEAFLIAKLRHQDEGIRLAAVSALRRMASNASQRVVDTLAKESLKDPTDSVVQATLTALQAFDPVMVSRAVSALIGMLTDGKKGARM